MAVSQRYESPDGLLRLLIDRAGDVMVGFEGFKWHTHADLLTPAYGPSEDEAVANFVRDILEDRAVLVVVRAAGEIQDVRVTDDPGDELKYAPGGQAVELRYWHGAAWSAA